MKMENLGLNCVFAAAFTLSICSAAPMECHFNSRGERTPSPASSSAISVCFIVLHVSAALCEFEGRHFSLGETWVDNACMHCTCLHPVGVGCCQTVHRPVDFPAWCTVRVEPVTCKVTLVQTVDPRLPCFPGEEVWDPSHRSFELQQHLELQQQQLER
uniref:Prostate-associated microseminoprotein n=1 Tax=Gouania willdenowi TaxID=441366 RepID=A0A8C5HXY9_GOUWI